MDLLNRDDPLFLFAQKLMANVADGSSTSFQAKAAHFRLSPDSGQHRCDKSSDRGEVTVTTEGATLAGDVAPTANGAHYHRGRRTRSRHRPAASAPRPAPARATPLPATCPGREGRIHEARRALRNRGPIRGFSKKTKTANEINGTGGRGGIRTHETLAGLPVFKTGALNHSATLP